MARIYAVDLNAPHVTFDRPFRRCRPQGLERPRGGYSEPIGRIYENQAAADEDVRWFWAIQVVGAHKAGIVTTGNAPTLDMAKAAFRRNWECYETWKAMQPPRTRAT